MQPTNLVADTICRTVELGLTVIGAAIGESLTHIECRPVTEDPTCPSCRVQGQLRDHVERILTDVPVVGHPTRLRVRIPQFACGNPSCEHSIFRQSIDEVAAPKATTTRRATRWILQRMDLDKMSVSAVAKALGLGWDTVNGLAMTPSSTQTPSISTGSESSAWTSTNGNTFADKAIPALSP